MFRGDRGYPKTGLIACGECSRQRAMVRMELDERRTEGVGTLDRCGPCRIIELEMEMRTVGGLRVEPGCRRAGRVNPGSGALMDGLLWLEFERLSPPLSNRKYWRVYAAFHPYKAIFPERTHDAPPLAFCSSRPAYPHRTGDAWLLLQDLRGRSCSVALWAESLSVALGAVPDSARWSVAPSCPRRWRFLRSLWPCCGVTVRPHGRVRAA